MSTHKCADINWDVENQNGQARSWECVQVAVLMDIRHQLEKLNSLLHCSNFTRIPATLSEIRRNTKKRKHHKKAEGR